MSRTVGTLSDRVDSLCWSHTQLKFCTGSKDGTAKIWTYERQQWKQTLLNVAETKPANCPPPPPQTGSAKNTKTKVTMVGWSRDDKFVVTAASDFFLRLWDPSSGTIVRFLQGHKDEAFVLYAHPLNMSVMLSAAHDGHIILWDLETGSIIKNHFNSIEGSGHGALFDACFSPNEGLSVAAVDSHGHVIILGASSNDKIRQVPDEQFFHTDYRPMISDGNGYVLDEQTQLAPNVMPPPFLTDANGAPHPPIYQRLVPGKERCSEAQLVPITVRQTGESTPVEVVAPSPPASRSASTNGSTSAAQVNHSNSEPLPLCAWVRGRAIVRPLLASVLSRIESQLKALREQEEERFAKELSRPPLPEVQPETSHSDRPETNQRRARKGRAANAPAYRTRTNPRPSAAYNSSDYVNPENMSDQQSSSSDASSQSESDSDTSDSDYSGDEPVGNTRARRRIRTRHAQTPEQEDEDEDEGSGDEDDEQRPSTSAEPKRVRKPRQRSSPGPKKAGSPRRKLPAHVPEYLCSFPEWMTATVTKRFPYFPQVGDEVAYFRQGHEWYLRAVDENNIYPLNKRYEPSDEADAEEFAIVDKISFTLRPFRLCCLKLSQIHTRTGERTGKRFTIKYHDVDGIPDWIVLKQHVEKSQGNKWKAGDRLKALIDNHWWFGTIDKREPLDSKFKRSPWQCLIVKWDNGDDERINPWDVEPCGKCARNSLAATDNDLHQLAHYEPKEDEWPAHGREAECDRIAGAIDQLSIMEPVGLFVTPVDLVMYATYPQTIPYPCDLTTVRERLENRFYRRVSAVEFDIRHILLNAQSYNELESEIVRNARVLYLTLITFISDSQHENVVDIYEQFQSLPDNELARNVKRALAAQADVHEAKTTTTNGKERDPEWKADCLIVLNDLLNLPIAEPFLNQDNPELADVYDSSVDLSTIMQRLQNNLYLTPDVLKQDVDSLLQNCRQMATNKRSSIYLNALRVQGQFNERMEPILERIERRRERVRQPSPRTRSKNRTNHHVYNTRSHPVPQARPQLRYTTTRSEEINGSMDDSISEEPKQEAETSRVTNGHRPTPRQRKQNLQFKDEEEESDEEHEQRRSTRKRKARRYSSSEDERPTRRRAASFSEDEPSSLSKMLRKTASERKPLENGNSERRTRYGGRRHVVYRESSDEEGEADNEGGGDGTEFMTSVSTRGRVRKVRRFY